MRLAELHAEVGQLRAELESTRAVAARLASLARGRTDGAALVPVRPPSGGRTVAGTGTGLGPDAAQVIAAAADVNPPAPPHVADAG
jgi:hypothetical protein